MKKTERIEIRVTKEMKQKLKDMAEAENCTVSSLIEEQLVRAIRERGFYIVGGQTHFKTL